MHDTVRGAQTITWIHNVALSGGNTSVYSRMQTVINGRMLSCDRLSQTSCTCCRNSVIERGRIVGLREAGWTYRRIAAHVGHNISVVCRCFQQWSVEYSHTRRLGSGRLHGIDARYDRRIMRAAVARAASRKEIWSDAAPVLSPRTTGNCLLAAGLRSRVSLARLPLTSRHRQVRLLWCHERVDKRVEVTLLSSVMRVGSVCMWMMVIQMHGIDLVSVVFWSAFAHNTQILPQASWYGGHQLQLAVIFGISAGYNKQCPLHCTGC